VSFPAASRAASASAATGSRRAAARAAALIAAALLVRAAADGDAPAPLGARAAPASGAARLLYGGRLDPNREPAPVLALLSGIGPARAAAIVAARPHCSLADLDAVPGVGPATLETLAASIDFADPPPPCKHELRPFGH
jgi:DNA uptake protein ComE-like DNA-binding protein